MIREFDEEKMRQIKRQKACMALIIITAIFGISAIVMFLWNAILPDLLNVKQISYWQSMGLLVLCKILFGGFKPDGKKHKAFGEGPGPFRNRWSGMSEEDKKRFKGEWMRRCHDRRRGQTEETQ